MKQLMWVLATVFACLVGTYVLLSWSYWWIPAIVATAIIMAYKRFRTRV